MPFVLDGANPSLVGEAWDFFFAPHKIEECFHRILDFNWNLQRCDRGKLQAICKSCECDRLSIEEMTRKFGVLRLEDATPAQK